MLEFLVGIPAMSWKAAQIIRDHYEGPMAKKFLLSYMALYADQYGRGASASANTLAKNCGMSLRYARTLIKELLDDRTISYQTEPSPHRSTVYSIDFVRVHLDQDQGKGFGCIPWGGVNWGSLGGSDLGITRETPASDLGITTLVNWGALASDLGITQKVEEKVTLKVEEKRGDVFEQSDPELPLKKSTKPKRPNGILADGSDPIEGTPLDTPQFREAWDEWFAYRQERKLPRWVDRTLIATVRKLEGWGERGAIESIRASIAGGWQGLFEPKAAGTAGRPKKPVRELLRPADPNEQDWDNIVRKF